MYQDTFLTALERCHKIDLTQNPKAVLLSITVKQWKSNRRKYARRQRIAPCVPLSEAQEDIPAQSELEETVISRAINEAVASAVDGLGEKLKLPVYLYYTLEMDINEIANVLNLPPGTVKSRLYHARAKIKEELEGKPDAAKRLERAAL